MIQLIKLRPYTVNGEIKMAHKFFEPPILAESIQDIYTDPNFYASQIPEKERWNVYFTACKAKIGSRSLLEQDIIPFDIDYIDVTRKGEYIEPICAVLGLSSDEVGIVFSGNGLQLMVGLKESFKTEDFFDEYREHYKAVCFKIDERLKDFNLPGQADSTAFSKSKLLRMPETINRKPDKPERMAQVLRNIILPNGFNLEKISGLPKLKRGDYIGKYEESRFPSPDTSSVLSGCSFLDYIKKGDYTEPQWYAALSILARLDNGVSLSHEYSKVHPKYKESVANMKIGQALEASGPRTCSNINSLWGMCGTCPNFQKVKSPIAIKDKDFIPEKIGKRISETFVVKQLVDLYGDNIVKKNGDLFVYLGGVWKHLNDDEICALKNKILSLYGGDAKSRDADSTYKSFYYKIRVSPVEMFKPNPYCVNFLNGTLHISKSVDQSWKKEFLPHNREDFLINQLNFDYSDDYSEKNDEFLSMLDRVFSNDEDKNEKILAIKQMYGACLIPAFPHLFMLHGKAGTGKTTVILPLYEFLRECNISSVEPYQFAGFLMESMAGKLVNIVTDIDTKKPIEDANIKKIEDRIPVRIDRKFKNAVHAPLPAIHIFGGNDIPPTLDGSSRAHSRRWTFIEFKSFQPTGHYDKSFASYVFNKSPRGILNFALEGLDELLLSRGHFLNPSSGKKRISEWMIQGDPLQQFLDDIENGDIRNSFEKMLIFDKEKEISRTEFYDIFVQWAELALGSRYIQVMSRTSFYAALRHKNFELLDGHGNRRVKGIGTKD